MINFKLQLSLLALTAISGLASAQDITKNTPPVVKQVNTSTKHSPITYNNQEVYVVVDKEPEFAGSLGDFLASNIRYPVIEKLIGITGKVFIQFIVGTDGSLSDIHSISSRSAGISAEAIRVISLSPKWQPGVEKGKPVRCMFVVPIMFNLDNGTKDKNTSMRALKKSAYVFLFSINGQTYSLEDAQDKLGDSFDPASVEKVEPYNDSQYAVPGKAGVYMITMKKS